MYFYDLFLSFSLPFGPRFVEWNEYAYDYEYAYEYDYSRCPCTKCNFNNNVVIRHVIQKGSMETFDFVAILKRLCVYDYFITEGSFTQLPGSLYLYSLRHLSSSSIWETSQSKATLVFSKLIVLCRISLSASSLAKACLSSTPAMFKPGKRLERSRRDERLGGRPT